MEQMIRSNIDSVTVMLNATNSHVFAFMLKRTVMVTIWNLR